jgi:hypothetical protein
MAPMSLLKTEKRTKQPSDGSFTSKQPNFSLKLTRGWHSLPLFDRKRALSSAGFVLPTIAILLLIMSLVVSSLLFRSVTRTTQVIGERNQQVIYNAATPAIDRAKAKLEYLFSRQEARREPLPSDSNLESIIKNTTSPVAQNPYDLPDETRLDLDGDGNADNAWSFQLDTNGDNTPETIAYSILIKTDDPGPNGAFEAATVTTTDDIDRTSSDAAKASKLVVRNGPVNLIARDKPECQDVYGTPEAGWDATTSSATVRRSFQVTALVVDSANQASRTVATLEMQQDREADRGNKWGAWFRNDLELFPGPTFRWNGAMHTEGNLMIGDSTSFRGFLISSPSSCLHTRSNSEITIGGLMNETAPPFLGQMIAGSMKTNTYDGGPTFDLFSNTPPITSVAINRDNDSVTPNTSAGTPSPANISLDPVVLFTTNEDISRTGDRNNNSSTVRDANWKTRNVVTQGRVLNQSAAAPYVDDTYRADDRYGPKAQYSDRVSFPSGKKVGDIIIKTGTGADPNADVLTKLDSTTVTISSTGEDVGKETQGLDGYWERRAWAEGLRVIVGQRLELGNAFGWQGSNDPLYPPQTNAASGSSMSDRANEQRQWKTMRDNLAAVQATAVYHSAGTSRDFPIACLATTAHPGTQQTIINSTTFSVDSSGVPTNINFLTGNGTNGWEFNPPTVSGTVLSNTTFASAIASNQPLGRALRNLARFAGDPYGAFPARQDTRDGVNSNDAVPSFGPAVHPYTNLAMWGDFSNLRRVFSLLDASTNPVSYSDLSVADKTTLHTAACTLGMLAYKLDVDIDAYNASLSSSTLQSAGVDISKLVDQTVSNGNPEIDDYAYNNSSPRNPQYQKSTWVDPNPASIIPDPENPGQFLCAAGADSAGFQANCDEPEFYSQFTKDQWLDAAGITGSTRAAIDAIATAIATGNQVIRDRSLGFREGNPPTPPGVPNGVYWDYSTGFTGETQIGGNKDLIVKVGCDPDVFYNVTASGGGQGSNNRARLALSLTFCGSTLPIKYPSLYYLFPVVNHNHDGNSGTIPSVGFNHVQPNEDANNNGVLDTGEDTNNNGKLDVEPYIADTYIFNPSSTVTDEANHNTAPTNPLASGYRFTYEVLQDSNSNGIEDSGDNGIDTIKILPKARSSWLLPNTTTTTGRVNLITQGTTSVAVPFLDKGIFNGREAMPVRVLDLDLDLLRRNTIGGETWLPNSGIIYAFREDNVREDGVARPSLETWANCDTANELGSTAATNNCRINATGTNPVDPPINSTTGISTKPVDFYADPDRRPHGFRLRKGEYIRHPVTNPVLRGLAFISDNPVYIMGDNCAFNLHSSAENATPACNNIDTNRIEEFTNLLDGDWGDFYTRGSGGTNGSLNTTFGRAGDTWRPAEIIADGISVLSNSFVDGSIAEGIRRADNGSRSSFRTLNAPGAANSAGDADRSWVREDGSVSNDVNAALPIKISRNGFPLYCVKPDGTDSGNLTNPNSCTGSSLREQAFGRESDALPTGFTTKPNSGTNRTYMTFDDGKDRIGVANAHRINATIVSALVPSRGGQSYGGFHNFPRFLENWGGRDLNIAGAFIQLNFSTSATAPFDQDSWEAGLNAQANDEDIPYYNPPNRRWGYDVGLQYAPAGPVAKRFLTPSNTRSEFYRELPLDDPYVCRLRRARRQVSGSWSSAGIDPDAPASCPSS